MPAWMHVLASLKTLDLSHNALASLSGHLGQCSSLTALSLADNLLEEMPACVEHLRQVASLFFLWYWYESGRVSFLALLVQLALERRCPRASGTCGEVASLFLCVTGANVQILTCVDAVDAVWGSL